MSAYFTIPVFTIILCYFLLILSFLIGWLRSKIYRPDGKSPITPISIIIPCRNEEENIRELFQLINSQDYPPQLIQIIWIDDHSTDRTPALLDELIANKTNNFLISLPDQITGKKAALKAGMEIATGELILLTDADSRHNTRWALTLAKYFEDTGTDLILGPVVIDPEDTGFEKIQKLEYLSLVASSIGAAGIGQPFMAQGPNIAVRASDYKEIVSNLNERFASGDDVFLLQAMRAIPGKKINYIMNQDAIVRAKPATSLRHFLQQRQRWASKASGYRNLFMIFTTLLIFAANLGILAALIIAFIGQAPFTTFFILLGIKTLAELPLLSAATKFFRCPNLLWWFLPVQLLYPIYIVVAGVLSQARPVRWKGRS
jgi:cellulose synthase/poly-beta-1,6-N-acetylglucosamine synthase-like glycosyltransferase